MRLLLLILLVAGYNLTAQAQNFDNEALVSKCGGIVYSKCDDATLNQKIIFESAAKLAVATNRKLLVNVGADWCPPCRILNQVLKKDSSDLQKLQSEYVIVKLNVSTESYKDLSKKQNWPSLGYPGFLILDPKVGTKPIVAFNANGSTVGEIHAEINAQIKNATVATTLPQSFKWFPELPQDTSGVLALWSKPIPLDKAAVFEKPLVTLPDGPNKATALEFYTQGLFYLHAFHWVDATRSFRQALLLEPNFYSAYVMISVAYDELGIFGINDPAFNPMMIARQISQKVKVTPLELDWGRFVEVKLCLRGYSICNQLGVRSDRSDWQGFQKLQIALAKKALAAKDVDVASLAAREVYEGGEELLEASVKLNPNHPGPHHYLVHTQESTNKYREATSHARRFAELAPQMAHSHHMYGHILPKVGKWQEAIVEFQKADAIHQKWYAETGAKKDQDWHYEHNLNLMAHAYFFGGETAKAESIWQRRCDVMPPYTCGTYIQALILNGKLAEAEAVINKTLLQNAKGKEGREAIAMTGLGQKYLSMVKLMKAKTKDDMLKILLTADLNVEDSRLDEGPLKTFGGRVLAIATLGTDRPQVELLTNLVQEDLSRGGFDSWSEATFEVEYLIRLADNIGRKDLAASLKLTKLSVGFRCK